MSIQIQPIHETTRGPIRLVIAGYRARVSRPLIESAGLSGSVYSVNWAAGKWTEAGPSVGVLARSLHLGVPAIRAGRVLAGVGSIAGGAGGMLALGVGQFRHRYWRAQRDAAALADVIADIPGIRDRTVHLIGHSLGTVVIRSALASLADRQYEIGDVMLMGGAASRSGWSEQDGCFRGRLINLYSPQDRVLSAAPIMDRVVGTGPIVADTLGERLVNQNLSEQLPNPLNVLAHHSGYWKCFAGQC